MRTPAIIPLTALSSVDKDRLIRHAPILLTVPIHELHHEMLGLEVAPVLMQSANIGLEQSCTPFIRAATCSFGITHTLELRRQVICFCYGSERSILDKLHPCLLGTDDKDSSRKDKADDAERERAYSDAAFRVAIRG